MELKKEPILISEILAEEDCEILVDGDLIVPDIKPDILKVLQVDATAYLSRKELGDGRVLLSGRVDMTVLYIPDCEGTAVQHIHTSFDFSHKLEKRAIVTDACVFAEADVVRAEFHVINSRKIGLKAIVGLSCEVVGAKQLDLVCGVEGAYAEQKKEALMLNTALSNRSETFLMKETLEVPAGKPAVAEVLKVDLKIGDKEIKPITEKVVAKGVLKACVLYMSMADSIEFMEFDVPFTEVFDLPGVYEGVNCTLDYQISDCNYEITGDTGGERRIVILEVTACAKLRASKQTEIEVIEDCYCPGYDTQLQFCEDEVDEIVASPSCQNTLREVVAIDKALPQIAGVYNVITKTVVSTTRIEGGKLEIEGKIDAYILYLTDHEQMPVYSYKKEIPFRYLLDAPESEDGLVCAVRAEVEHTSYHLNVANEVELRCILSLSADIIRKRKLSLLCEAEILPISCEDKKGIVIYFVQPGDSVWSIAKRYRVPMTEIIDNNQLCEPEKLLPGTRLVIPACRKVS